MLFVGFGRGQISLLSTRGEPAMDPRPSLPYQRQMVVSEEIRRKPLFNRFMSTFKPTPSRTVDGHAL